MSIAGILSNRGDIYQLSIAFDWALTVLSNPEFQWLEVDSTTYQVDDIVIGKYDGTVICCQCKKNQPNFKAWSIADLEGELDKAFLTLAENQKTQVYFYSRNNFGVLNKLHEYSNLRHDQADYLAGLTKEHTETNKSLENLIKAKTPSLSAYEFLHRTRFEVSPDFERLKTLLYERLHRIANNSRAAFNALWTDINNLGGHTQSGNPFASAQYRLTKDDIKNIFYHSGAMLVPVMDIAQVRTSFSSTSAIGRSWHRDIAGYRIPNPVVNKLLDAIDTRKRSILLTGGPGSGKTCVMLNLQEALEQRTQTQADLVPLFIQAREFTDLTTAQDRQAQGLSEQWVEQAARLAEDTHVVVAIDSLDVLSIAREHSVLTYFLAQIDRLLQIPNITVVTACRDFDRKYDRDIAARQWDCELQCPMLDWESEIAPLLATLDIDSTSLDVVTRELIRNPRELALFVELAQREGSFNVLTGQALAQRYLYAIVQSDPALGDEAMLAIEAIADEMLTSRSLSIPRQRFKASEDILRRLHSLNILQYTHDGELTFGHQTLLDVLVISSTIRKGFSLNEFIQSLPPVPFVRPSIRSFVEQLATGERRKFRKQLRAVLTSKAAFHIRRLVAKSFAQQRPQDDDWPMIRDLRDNHREVFQEIYTQASLIEWHDFWLTHLVPELKEMQDSEGLITHVYQVEKWKNEDTAGVLAFWTEALKTNWLDKQRIVEQLIFLLSKFKTENLSLVAPLLEQLVSMPIPEYSSLGRVIARCVDANVADDRLLWRYITVDISEEDIITLDFKDKLRCQPYEFGSGNKNFLNRRIVQSTTLLDLALKAIEEWSQIDANQYGSNYAGHREGFLWDTSYRNIHSQTDIQPIDSESILLDAIEGAILNHAQRHTDWWQNNRERLCFNKEGALCYFAILAFTNYPQRNIDLSSRLLCDRNLLESKLSYELSTLIQAAFIYLDSQTQNAVIATIQTIYEEFETEKEAKYCILKEKAEYISAIPCHLRAPDAQAILDAYEKTYGTLIRQPSIGIFGGVVTAPFSFEVFLSASDDSVIHLLEYYSTYKRTSDDLFIEGTREVGGQLREASSRHPSRFLELLVTHWIDIAASFRDDIMEGIANYLAYRHGNLRPNGQWIPIEEPDAPALASQILEELERHPAHWWLNRSAATVLESCAYIIQDKQNAARLVFWTIGFGNLKEEIPVRGGSDSLLNTGINMRTGRVAKALMILVNNLQENNIALPELLPPTLCQFASNKNPAIRVIILLRLPYLQYKNPELGWKLFSLTIQDSTGLWKYAERCLYYSYRDHSDKVLSLLDLIRREGSQKDMETWGRISALSALNGNIDFDMLLDDLKTLDIIEAWHGAGSVWTHPSNIKQHRKQCLKGIEAGLKAGKPHAMSIAKHMNKMFREDTPPITISKNLIELCINVCENDTEDKHRQIFKIEAWLNSISQRNPTLALDATEIYLAYIDRTKQYYCDHENQLVQLLTRLFAEAEEREESDDGAMLDRVVSVQDLLLSLGVNSINDWLRAAERQ